MTTAPAGSVPKAILNFDQRVDKVTEKAAESTKKTVRVVAEAVSTNCVDPAIDLSCALIGKGVKEVADRSLSFFPSKSEAKKS
ncbi:MAG: hypothetical protein H0W88_06165 [Parachlamydiaceae bacterium]|nr:hypothetical protein [Parachlamydiaceae bacterium]